MKNITIQQCEKGLKKQILEQQEIHRSFSNYSKPRRPSLEEFQKAQHLSVPEADNPHFVLGYN